MFVTSTMIPSSPFASSSTPPYNLPFNRKRRAASPPPPPSVPLFPVHNQAGPSTSSSASLEQASPSSSSRISYATDLTPELYAPSPGFVNHKRRRRNLASGFNALSISPKPSSGGTVPKEDLPTYVESQFEDALAKRVDEDDESTINNDLFGPSLYLQNNDGNDDSKNGELRLSSSSRRKGKMPIRNNYVPGLSGKLSEDDEEGERQGAWAFRIPQQDYTAVTRADEVQLPEDYRSAPLGGNVGDILSVVDITDQRDRARVAGTGRKRRTSSPSPVPHKRVKETMDLDDEEMDDPRGRRRSRWYEPEKDRIIYTNLGSSDSERSTSRSPSPSLSPTTSSTPPSHLIQPGQKGFTITPSMLTRLLAANKTQLDDLNIPNLSFYPNHEKGLVLYRPLGIPPGVSSPTEGRDWREVVKEWVVDPNSQNEDRGRFEEVDDDEVLEQAMDEDGRRMDGQMEMDGIGGVGHLAEQEGMDVDM